MSGKGSARRPAQVASHVIEAAWDRIFPPQRPSDDQAPRAEPLPSTEAPAHEA